MCDNMIMVMTVQEESQLEPMTQAANSIVCSESNSLLQHLFQVPATDVHSIKFSSSVCEESTYKCNQCLERNYCHPTEGWYNLALSV